MCGYFAICGCSWKSSCPAIPSKGESWKTAAGLKIVIVFVHRDFQLEVWLSGVNRKAQCAWAEKLGAGAPPFLPSQDPARTDYILRAPVAAELSQGPAVLAALLDQLQQLRASLKAYL